MGVKKKEKIIVRKNKWIITVLCG